MSTPRSHRSASRRTAPLLAVAAATLLGGAVSCSAFREDAPVRFVHNTEDASGCTKVADVAAAAQLPDSQVVTSIATEARKVEADTVVLAKGERKGTAYRCEAPQVAGKKDSKKDS